MAPKKTIKKATTASSNVAPPQNSKTLSDEPNLETTETENQTEESTTQTNPSLTDQNDPETDSSSSDDDSADDELEDGADDEDVDGDTDEEDAEDSEDDSNGDGAADGGTDAVSDDDSVVDAPVVRRIGTPNGRIIGIGEEVTFEADRHETYAVIKEDVFQEKRMRGSNRVTYTQVYTKGTSIPLSALEQK